MIRSKIIFGVVSCLLTTAAWGQSKPAYTAADIERHFSQKDLGAARSLCIGVESECAKTTGTRPKIGSGFDLIVNFNYNSDTLTEGAKANLDEFAKALRGASLDHSSFMVEGHTDAKGSDGFNMDLSARRAQAVVHYLEGRGVEASRLQAKALGKSRPRTQDPSAPENRRVEARLQGE
ncbi:OmpA family protein [Methylobacterium longum]|uniref:OmpA family protein n=1 Tax=Methylobacterium longum TaxID=767694 RepID=A0ABT8AVB0_9HYPH|nr:OmpA family protein [Methylobacterium longum]MDN3573346.1 OmpA family protein [Methylobacterium longum]GJE13941.1 Peptidoglycan-associated lipoprotein [Methylobacterium longum]